MAILTLKVYNDGEIRRIPFDAPSSRPIYSNLVQKIRSSITDLDLTTATINWKDNEGDFIVLRTDEEALEAIKNAKDAVLKLYVIEKDGPMPPPSVASSVIIEDDQEREALMDDDYAPDEDQPNEQPVDDAEEPERDSRVHRGVVCDGCNGPIAGRRFKCCVCYDYDLCKDCEEKGTETADHKSTHPVILLSSPRALRQHPWLRFMMQRMTGQCRRGPPPGCDFPADCGPPPFGPWNAGCGPQMFRGGRGHRGGPRGGRGCHWGVHRGMHGCKRGQGHHKGCKETREFGCPDWVRDMRNAMDSSFGPAATEECTATHKEKGAAANTSSAEMPGAAADVLRCVGENVANVLGAFGIDVDIHTAGECSESCPGHTQADKSAKSAPAQSSEGAEPMNEGETTEKSSKSAETPIQIFIDPSVPKDKVAEEANKDKNGTDWVLLHPAKAMDAEGTDQQAQIYPQISQQDSNAATNVTETDQVATISHPDPRVATGLRHMINMGFTNDGGWLTQLLEAKNGDISAVLDTLAPASRRT